MKPEHVTHKYRLLTTKAAVGAPLATVANCPQAALSSFADDYNAPLSSPNHLTEACRIAVRGGVSDSPPLARKPSKSRTLL